VAIISDGTTIADAGAFSVNLGSMVHIKSITAAPGGGSDVANMTFIHGTSSVVFDNTYPIYIVKLINVMSSSGQNFQLNVTTDGSNFNVVGTNSTFGFEHSEDNGTARSFYATGYDSENDANHYIFNHNKGGLKDANDAGASGEIMFFNPSNTTFQKHYIARINSMSEYPGSTDNFTSGIFHTTSAITGFRINSINSNNMHGKIKLYGLADS